MTRKRKKEKGGGGLRGFDWSEGMSALAVGRVRTNPMFAALTLALDF